MAGKRGPKRLVEISIVNIAARTGELFVQACEDAYRERIAAAADAIQASGRHLVMLTGPSSSGKTTTSNRLAGLLRSRGVAAEVISLDDFFLDPEQYPRLPDGSKDYENVMALDIPLVNQCLSQVVETGATVLPQFDFLSERRAAAGRPLTIGQGILIVEGIHAHNPLLTSALPQDKVYKVYAGLEEEYAQDGRRVLATRDVRLARRMVRDHQFRGADPYKTLQLWPGVLEGEKKYIRCYKPDADHVIDTSFSYEIECLAPRVAALAAQYCNGTAETEPLALIARRLAVCDTPLEEYVPADSMLREFLG